MRPIDANVVVKELLEIRSGLKEGFSKRFQQETIRKALRVVEEAPTLTYEDLVPHGRWVPLEYDGYADGFPVWDLWECSVCQEEHEGDEDTLTPFCPNCGAKLDGKNKV